MAAKNMGAAKILGIIWPLMVEDMDLWTPGGIDMDLLKWGFQPFYPRGGNQKKTDQKQLKPPLDVQKLIGPCWKTLVHSGNR